MPKPKTKQEILDANHFEFEKLIKVVNENDPYSEFPEGMLNRNIRDVIGHLYHWHIMFLDWYEVGMKGEKPDMPAKGHTWKTTPALNREIQAMYSETSFEKIMDDFKGSHNAIETIIRSHSEEELFTKKLYGWTGSTSLGSYIISASSAHYRWASKLIKKSL